MTSNKLSEYECYRDSGIEWLGEVPEHWNVMSIKWAATRIQTGCTPPTEQERFYNKGTLPWYGPSSFGDSLTVGEPVKRLNACAIAEGKARLFTAGTILLVGIGATIGKSALADVVCSANQQVTAIEFSPSKVVSKFAAYSTRRLENVFRDRAQYTTMPIMNQSETGVYCVAIPPLPEQKQIASFLDYETAKIDALIEKQQQLIALLGEKRQAVISHAVTKGLNPDAPMRDSGVEWLGEVPEHWEVSKFGYVSSVVRGGSPRPAGDPTLFNGDYSPWVTVAEVTKDNRMGLTETSSFLTKKGSEQSRLFQPGTLLLSNSGATLGVPKVLMIQANANDGVVGFEHLRHNREFCYFYLASLTENLRERIKQGSGQPNLNTDIVKHIEIPIPPDEETDAIVAHVTEQLEKLAKLVDRAGDAMELLQERRTALISAAVTGKIDVRGWKPPSA